jgi:hypothetical protein
MYEKEEEEEENLNDASSQRNYDNIIPYVPYVPQNLNPGKMSESSLLRSYQSSLNDEYILKLFYFSSQVSKYCLCEYIE